MHSPILSLLTSTAVVLHALVGCCGHHVHADQALECGDAHQIVQSTCGCRHSRIAPAADADSPACEDSEDRRDGRDEPCNGPECQFVGVERVDDVDQALSIPVWLPLNDCRDLSTRDVALSPSPFLDLCTHPLRAMPVRAATQVWLL